MWLPTYNFLLSLLRVLELGPQRLELGVFLCGLRLKPFSDLLGALQLITDLLDAFGLKLLPTLLSGGLLGLPFFLSQAGRQKEKSEQGDVNIDIASLTGAFLCPTCLRFIRENSRSRIWTRVKKGNYTYEPLASSSSSLLRKCSGMVAVAGSVKFSDMLFWDL